MNCTIQGCEGRIVARGYCGKHYQRWKKNGDPLVTLTPGRGVFIECAVDGCGRRSALRGFCRTHYSRMLSTGDPEGLKRAPNGSGWISHGYRVLPLAGHPLSSPQDRVFEHRKVLYDKIGPDGHPCNWCGVTVRWLNGVGAAAEGALIADHVDGDTLNNVPSNLVPSCWSCNVNRAKVA